MNYTLNVNCRWFDDYLAMAFQKYRFKTIINCLRNNYFNFNFEKRIRKKWVDQSLDY